MAQGKTRGSVDGGGMIVKSGEPSQNTISRRYVPDFEVIEYAVGPKDSNVSLFFLLAGGFFARVVMAWRVLVRGEVRGRMHPRVSLDLSRRLVKAAALAELGQGPDEREEG